MKRKSTDYSTPDAGGWMHVCDDLFLARFRGMPCEICGARKGYYSGKTIRSMGHHLLSKELHRKYRYDPENIITLCPKHHLGAEMSPHSHDGAAVAAFYEWLKKRKPRRFLAMLTNRNDKFNKEWCYRDMYVELGGEIHSKTGLLKDLRPKNHAKTKITIMVCHGAGFDALTEQEKKTWNNMTHTGEHLFIQDRFHELRKEAENAAD